MSAVGCNDKYRFDDRREYNYGPPNGLGERRYTNRREGDKFKVWLKAIFDWHMEETISDEQVRHILEPVLKKIQAGAFS